MFLSQLLLFTLISACGDSSTSAQKLGPDEGEITDGGTCTYQAGDGERAQMPGGTPRQSDITVLEKTLDLRFLSAALKASAQSTADLIQSTGFGLFQVQTQRRFSCSPFAFLPQAAQKLNELWSKGGSPGAVLLGQFYSKSDSRNPEGRGVLLLRPDTTRWTLVHEFMHALYEFDRENKGSPHPRLQQQPLQL